MDLIADLAARVEALGDSSGRRVLVGIAGAPASGKTTLAEAVVRRLAGREDWRGSRAAHVPLDGFHLADAELLRLGLRERKGAPETFDAEGYRAVIARIAAGEEVYAPSFERTLEQPLAGALPIVPATRFVLSEGNYLLLPSAPWCTTRVYFDEVWFCRTDPELREHRLRARHIRFGKTPARTDAWIKAVDEPNASLVEATMWAADVVLDLP